MQLSEFILLGEMAYERNDGSQWVSDKGCSGCALGRAYLAAGGEVFANRTICAEDIASIWPWLREKDIMDEISEMFCEVTHGTLTMDELVDFVAYREPAALEATIESPWERMVREGSAL